VQQLAGLSRHVRQGSEPDGETYNVGSLSAMPAGFAYPLHFDSLHANAWITLREWFCGETVPFGKHVTKGVEPSFLGQYRMLRRHTFAAAAIFTVQAPQRDYNPYDLRVYNARWPVLVRNCSWRSMPSGSIYQRVVGNPFAGTDVPFVDITGESGDLYLFNSENFHITPNISGASARTVLTALAAYSEGSDTLELYG